MINRMDLKNILTKIQGIEKIQFPASILVFFLCNIRSKHVDYSGF